MSEHDNTTALPDANEVDANEVDANITDSRSSTDQPTSASLSSQDKEAPAEQFAEETALPSDDNSASAGGAKGLEASPHTETKQGSGAVSARQSIPLSVSASDPKAFGASLDDIAAGRVTVRFDV